MLHPAAAHAQFATFSGIEIYKGGEAGNYRVRDHDECLAMCRGNNDCVGYDYDTRSKYCYLKDALGGAKPYGPALSGIRLSDLGYTVHVDGTARLNVRNGPGLSAQVIGTIDQGVPGYGVRACIADVERRTWCYLDGKGVAGWASTKFLRPDEASTKTVARDTRSYCEREPASCLVLGLAGLALFGLVSGDGGSSYGDSSSGEESWRNTQREMDEHFCRTENIC